jgi:hypothetical protein
MYPNNTCWQKLDTPTVWDIVELWSPNKEYTNKYLYYNETIWWIGDEASMLGVNPSIDSRWTRFYSLQPERSFLYDMETNNILNMNDVMYLCNTRIFESESLNNGVDVYINNKYKNILINIYINDNTYGSLNIERDKLYDIVYSKLTSGNFIQYINDYNSNYGFINNIRYIVMDGDIDVYDFNSISSIVDIPFILTCQYPDNFYSKIDSNIIKSFKEVPVNLNANITLKGGRISSGEQINYYLEGKSFANQVAKNFTEEVLNINYHGLKNVIYNELWRYSGPYTPIFKNIRLFDYSGLKFLDTDEDFGITGEIIISKVNRNDIVLKLRNSKSIYPMLDEIGYTVTKRFIFKSSWDYTYYLEVNRK